MSIFLKRKPSDWAVTVLGGLGFMLGLMILADPGAQYDMMGIDPAAVPSDSIIPGLFGSGALSAMYVGLMYIYGTQKGWNNFKAYLIFARLLMCLGFLVLVCMERASKAFIPAAIWEGAGALVILLALWWDGSRNPEPSRYEKAA
jgi:hypothetical protein